MYAKADGFCSTTPVALRSAYHFPDANSKLVALIAGLEGLGMLMKNLDSAYVCPVQAAKHFKLVADIATHLADAHVFHRYLHRNFGRHSLVRLRPAGTSVAHAA